MEIRLGDKLLVLDMDNGLDVLKALGSNLRINILKNLHHNGPQNLNKIAENLGVAQSTISLNIQPLIDSKLLTVENKKGIKGNQKICYVNFSEILIKFQEEELAADLDIIDVAMPLGLYTNHNVTAPCGLCSVEGIIGLLDVPSTYLDPERMRTALLWFTNGYVEYQFPNNAQLSNKQVEAIEFTLELSSEVPGTNANWPSDIFLTVNGVRIGTWTSPGDFGDKRGAYTPKWWKEAGSQYGKRKTWRIGQNGSYVDGIRISDIKIQDLNISDHHSVRMRIGVDENAQHPGGINILKIHMQRNIINFFISMVKYSGFPRGVTFHIR